jgi:hypothetical protein
MNWIWTERLEGAVVFLTCLYYYNHSGYPLLWFALLFFTIDISIAGYFWGPKIGARIYNFFHGYYLPTLLLVVSMVTSGDPALAFAFIWAAHIGLDRAFGFGLKLETDFKDTHLGRIGRP